MYARSKGRTPSVYLFNPFAEARIAQGKPFNPTQHQAQLARDLENLPQFLCRQDDIVLVAKRPTVGFLSGIKQAGFALPEFVELDKPIERPSAARSSSEGEKAGARGLASLAHRKLGRLRPWAWGPDSVELLKPLFASVTGEERTPDQRFNEGIAHLYSKVWSAEFLRKLLRTTCRGDEADSHVGSVELSRGANVPEARQYGPAEHHPPPNASSRTGAEADEVQETLIAVAKKIGEFKHAGNRGSFRAWLYQQARWRIADQFRARTLGKPRPVTLGESHRDSRPSCLREITSASNSAVRSLTDVSSPAVSRRTRSARNVVSTNTLSRANAFQYGING